MQDYYFGRYVSNRRLCFALPTLYTLLPYFRAHCRIICRETGGKSLYFTRRLLLDRKRRNRVVTTMADFLKSLVMIALFVLPVALVGLAVVCFGHCVSDMMDDREPSTAAEQARSNSRI